MMTKLETLNLYGNLQKLGNLKGVKFAYAVAKNLALIKGEVDILTETTKKLLEPTDVEYRKFGEERVTLAESFAKKDDKGNAIKIKKIENGQEVEVFDGLDNNPKWEKAFEKLREEYKIMLDARDEVIKEQNELLKTESTLQLYKIALHDVPADISVNQMKDIAEIVSEDLPSPYKS